MDKMLYGRREAVRLLSISLRSLDYLISGKQLVSRRVGRRVLVPQRALEQFVRTHHIVAKPSSSFRQERQNSVAGASQSPQDARQLRTEG
jgi:hypothetical protein